MRRRRGCGCLGALLGIVLVIAVVFVVENGADYLLYAPWAYGYFGQPTLTGSWTGTMTAHSGVRYAVYLQLNRDRTRRGTPLNGFGKADIDGHVSWCARGIRNGTSTLFGHANRSASDVVLEIQDFSHLPAGLFPIRFQGAWHGSSLALHVVFYLSLGPAHGYSTGSPDTARPVPATLHKQGYSAFQAACARL
jgi:hypothetical protein